MAAVNTRRVVLGALAGGVVWSIWSTIVNVVILEPQYKLAQSSGTMLSKGRYPYPLFLIYWFVTIFLLAYVVAWLYSSVRATRGAGPGTALTVGLLVGFAAGFPMNLTTAAWAPISRYLPLWWMLDLWLGAIMASLVAGWIYKD
jgi:hypothetical protein